MLRTLTIETETQVWVWRNNCVWTASVVLLHCKAAAVSCSQVWLVFSKRKILYIPAATYPASCNFVATCEPDLYRQHVNPPAAFSCAILQVVLILSNRQLPKKSSMLARPCGFLTWGIEQREVALLPLYDAQNWRGDCTCKLAQTCRLHNVHSMCRQADQAWVASRGG